MVSITLKPPFVRLFKFFSFFLCSIVADATVDFVAAAIAAGWLGSEHTN